MWGNQSKDAAAPNTTGQPIEGEMPLLSEHQLHAQGRPQFLVVSAPGQLSTSLLPWSPKSFLCVTETRAGADACALTLGPVRTLVPSWVLSGTP